MNRIRVEERPRARWTKNMLQAAALVLLVGLALPARAGDDRAVKSRVAPVYPEIAKRLRIGGEVKLEATVDAQGKVKDVKAVSGNHCWVRLPRMRCANGNSSLATVMQP